MRRPPHGALSIGMRPTLMLWAMGGGHFPKVIFNTSRRFAFSDVVRGIRNGDNFGMVETQVID